MRTPRAQLPFVRKTLRRNHTAIGVLAALALAILPGCGTDSPMSPEKPAPSASRWQQELSATPIRAIWGSRPDALYVNGGAGYVTRYDGTRSYVVPTVEGTTVLALCGSAENDVFAAAGTDILHFDGSTWSSVYQGGGALVDIWESASDDVFAVGSDGLIVHFDGSRWQVQDSGTTRPLTSIQGSSSTNVFVHANLINQDYSVLRYDGTKWSRASTNAGGSITSVTVDERGLAYAGSTDGFIYRGVASLSDWSYYGITTDALLVAGSSVFAIDGANRLYEQSSLNATPVLLDLPGRVRSLWLEPSGSVYAVGDGGMIARRDDAAWIVLREPVPLLQLNAIFGADDASFFALGYSSSFVFDGSTWKENALADAAASQAGWAVSRDFAIAVGSKGAIDRWNGIRWIHEDSPISEDYVAAWAFTNADAFAVSFQGTLTHSDGHSWSAVASLPYHAADMHGTSPDDVWMAPSVAGHVLRYDGSLVHDMTNATTQLPRAIWAVTPSSVFVVGDGGMVVHYDGDSWTEQPTPTTDALLDVWARASDDVYALTDRGDVLHFDGTEWSFLVTTPGRTGLSIWGDDTSLVSAGYATSVFRWGK
jgi:hypothetical protein